MHGIQKALHVEIFFSDGTTLMGVMWGSCLHGLLMHSDASISLLTAHDTISGGGGFVVINM